MDHLNWRYSHLTGTGGEIAQSVEEIAVQSDRVKEVDVH